VGGAVEEGAASLGIQVVSNLIKGEEWD